MQRILGMILGVIFINVGMPYLFGDAAPKIGLSIAIVAIPLIAIALWERWKIRRIGIAACDDALKYAQKSRLAFGKPPFTPWELKRIKAARRHGDYTSVHSIIAASNIALQEAERAGAVRGEAQASSDVTEAHLLS